MRTIILCHKCLRRDVRFTDPLLHSIEKEEEIVSYFVAGALRPPSLVEDGDNYLIFSGNHRVLVAINRGLTIQCVVLEALDDVLCSQEDEGEDFRDVSGVLPLTFDGILADLRAAAARHADQDPDAYSYADF